MAKHRLFLLTSLVFLSNILSSCNAVLPLWDYSNLYEYNQDEHYKIKDGKKVSIEKHNFNKLIEVYTSEDGTAYYDHACVCGWKASYASFEFNKIENEDGYELTRINPQYTGYYVNGLVTNRENNIYGLYSMPNKYEGLPITKIAKQAFKVDFNNEKYKKFKFGDSFKLTENIKTISQYGLAGITIPMDVNLPNIEVIESNGFSSSNIVSIKLGSKLQDSTLVSSLFANCENLKSIMFECSWETTPWGCFNGCSSLTDITWSKNLKIINPYTFQDCTSLTHIEIPDGVEELLDNAFMGCTNLKTVILPKSVKKVLEAWFFNPSSDVEKVYYKGSKTDWYDGGVNWYVYSDIEDYTNIRLFFYSEERPAEEGHYWHYVNNVPTVW